MLPHGQPLTHAGAEQPVCGQKGSQAQLSVVLECGAELSLKGKNGDPRCDLGQQPVKERWPRQAP